MRVMPNNALHPTCKKRGFLPSAELCRYAVRRERGNT